MKSLLVGLLSIALTTGAAAQGPAAAAPPAAAAAAPADMAERLEVARQLMAVPGLVDVYLPAFDDAVATVVTDGPPTAEAAARYAAMLKSRRAAVEEAGARTYARVISLAGLKGELSFYETPVGRRIATKWVQFVAPAGALLSGFGAQMEASNQPGGEVPPLPDIQGRGPAPSAVGLALGEQLIEASHAVRFNVTLPTGFESLPPADQARLRAEADKVSANLQRLKQGLEQKLASLYAKVFSEEEMQALLAFYQAPAGAEVNDANREMNVDFQTEDGGALIALILVDALRPASDPEPATEFVFQAEPSAARLDLARRMLDASGARENFTKGFSAMAPGLASSMPKENRRALEASFAALADRYRAHAPELMELAARAYARNFSEAQLEGQLDFMLSPAGKAFSGKMSELSRRLGGAVSGWATLGPAAPGAPPSTAARGGDRDKGPMPSPAAMALAMQIVEVSHAACITFNNNGRARRYGERPLTAEEEAALEPFELTTAREALAQLPQAKRSIALVYARTFSEEELRGILGFFRSPAGRILRERTPWLNRDMSFQGRGLMQRIFGA